MNHLNLHSNIGLATYWQPEPHIWGYFYHAIWCAIQSLHVSVDSMSTGSLSLYFLYSALFRSNLSSLEKGRASLFERCLLIKEAQKIALLRLSVGTKLNLKCPWLSGLSPSVSAPALMNYFHLYHKLRSPGSILFLDKNTCILGKLALRVTSPVGQTVCVSLGQEAWELELQCLNVPCSVSLDWDFL